MSAATALLKRHQGCTVSDILTILFPHRTLQLKQSFQVCETFCCYCLRSKAGLFAELLTVWQTCSRARRWLSSWSWNQTPALPGLLLEQQWSPFVTSPQPHHVVTSHTREEGGLSGSPSTRSDSLSDFQLSWNQPCGLLPLVGINRPQLVMESLMLFLCEDTVNAMYVQRKLHFEF